jgi:uncharacterized protein (UPF0548 family)
VLLFARPSEAEVEHFLAEARESGYSYSETGATSGIIPPLYTTDHNRVWLGLGPQTWRRAVEALKEWKMFDLEWICLYWPSTPIAVGENVAVLAQHLNCYWLNACRIVYVVANDGPSERFGFAYGTLDDHAESGEERFLVEWDRETDEVWYDILAFSRPNQFLARIGYPFARQLQKRFAAGSKAAMVKAVSQAIGREPIENDPAV